MPTHYDTLGILRGSSLAEIKAAYRALALKCHPDKAHGLPPIEVSKRESRFKVISSAYEILSDPVRRASYD
ncbi:heat shock protein DnaJ, partial [Polyplosphaeria fusca]